MDDWGLFTSHGLVLASVAKNPARTAREVGDDVGLTERTTHRIILDLEKAGYISRTKVGRNNTYSIHPDVTIRDQVTDASVGQLLAVLGWKRRKTQKAETSKKPD
jgi:DNA-binding IclR family transcriptional regulator